MVYVISLETRHGLPIYPYIYSFKISPSPKPRRTKRGAQKDGSGYWFLNIQLIHLS